MRHLLAAMLAAVALMVLIPGGAAEPTFPLHGQPRPVPPVNFQDGESRDRSLSDFAGKVVLLNIWATWCVPCRKEMPTLDRLQARLGGPEFAVVAMSIDRGGKSAVEAFYMETNVQHLDIYLDRTSKAAGDLGALGLPTMLLLDRQGRELGRLVGPAEWDSPAMVALLKRQIERPTSAEAPADNESNRSGWSWWRRAVEFVRGLTAWRESFLDPSQTKESNS